jgi:hypothetical protein
MNRPSFLITIDTEGDDLWTWKDRNDVRTENARFLPRFQAVCERYNFKPTYLTNYEMAVDPTFRTFGRSVLERGAAEIGLHVHAWNSPPLTGREEWDGYPIYITELPTEIMREKTAHLTDVLEETFGMRPVSHRGGRWAFDSRLAKILEDLGYLVDCSVTPGVSWRQYPGSPTGNGGASYEGFQVAPYFMNLDDISRAGSSPLLEVPVTIRSNYSSRFDPCDERHVTGFALRVWKKLAGPPHSWLRPNGGNLREMLSVVDWALARQLPVLEFILHSSELMPGGSPTFRHEENIEQLYSHLERLFEHVAASGAIGETLAEYRRRWEPDLSPRSLSAH